MLQEREEMVQEKEETLKVMQSEVEGLTMSSRSSAFYIPSIKSLYADF
jgi:hypothetical protein